MIGILSRILLSCRAFRTESAIVDLRVVEHEVPRQRVRRRVLGEGNVGDAVAGGAEEMCVSAAIGVVFRGALVDGDHHHRALFHQKFQCIVDGRLGKCGNVVVKCGINVLHTRMGEVLHQVTHHGDALYRGLDAVG